jgi:hypothetical protein
MVARRWRDTTNQPMQTKPTINHSFKNTGRKGNNRCHYSELVGWLLAALRKSLWKVAFVLIVVVLCSKYLYLYVLPVQVP